MVFTSVLFPVYADYGDDPGDLIPEYDTPQTGGNAGVGSGPLAPLGPILGTGGGFFVLKGFWDILKETVDIIDFIDDLAETWGVKDPLQKANFCPVAAEQTYGLAPWHTWTGSGLILDDYVCGFCGMTYGQMSAKFQELYLGYTTDLPSDEASYQYQPQGFVGTVGSDDRYFSSLDSLFSKNFPFFHFLKECGIQEKVMVFACNKNQLIGFFFDANGILKVGYFTGIDNEKHVSCCTMYDYAVLRLTAEMTCSNNYDGLVFYDRESAINYSDYLTTRCLCIDWEKNGDAFWKRHNGNNFYLYAFEKSEASSVFSSDSAEYGVMYRNGSVDGDFSGYGYCLRMDEFELIGGYVLTEPEGSTADSRPSGIMDAIQNYNTTNNYIDNSVVNYYIGSFDENDNLTGYYPMDIFDEQTLVFTEPVTGAQYQTTGWRYDYAARRYTLDLEPGTFSLGDYDILQIKLTYGDEAVTIQYYNELGELVETDEYQYIMVAKEECTLNGHTYSAETTKEPTCTAAGERLLTCSVCGNQTVDEIPMTQHSSTFSVMKEPTCTAQGLGLYTCSTCGMQYTELIPALEHTGVLLEVVDTVYGESSAVISVGYSVYECSTCGTQYVVHDDAGSGGAASGFWGSLVDSFANALAAAIDAVLGAIIYILETILGLIKSLLGFFYSFITDTVLGGISDMFAAFSDGTLFEFFQNDDGTVGLPSEVGTVFGFYSGIIMALPWEIRSVMFFGIAALILIAIFNLQ